MPENSPTLFRVIARGSAIVLGSNILLKAIAFLATLLLLRDISVYDYGLWRLLLSVLTFVGIFTLPGLDPAIRADLGREAGQGNHSRYRAIFIQFSGLLLSLAAVVAVGLFIAAPYITVATGIGVTLYVRILAVCVFTSALLRVYSSAFSTHLHFYRAQGITICSSFFYLVLLIVFLYIYNLGLLGVVMAYALSSAMSVIIFFLPFVSTVRAELRAASDPSYSLWHSMIRQHGKWALVSDYSDTTIGSIKPWLIGYFISIEAVGIFSAAVTLLSALSNILPLSQVLASVLPRQAADREKLLFFSNRSIKYTLWAYALLALGVLVTAPIAIPLLLPQYAPAIPLLSVLLLSLASLAWGDISNTLLNVLRLQKLSFVTNTTARVLSVACILPLGLMLFGVWGAVIDQIATSYIITALRVLYVRRALPAFGPRVRELFTFDIFDRSSLMRIARYIKPSV